MRVHSVILHSLVTHVLIKKTLRVWRVTFWTRDILNGDLFIKIRCQKNSHTIPTLHIFFSCWTKTERGRKYEAFLRLFQNNIDTGFISFLDFIFIAIIFFIQMRKIVISVPTILGNSGLLILFHLDIIKIHLK